jgi:glycosyltransferase involved in cell wall biosynthesis
VRLLLASHRYFPAPGGTEKVVQTLAEGLARRGHEVTVLTQREAGTPGRERLHDVEVVRLAMHRLGGFRIPARYLRTLREEPVDLFHLWGNRIWCADFYYPWARSFAWPQVLTGLGFYQWEVHPRRFDRWYFPRYLPWAIGGFDRYTTSTERERAQLLGWGVRPDRLVPVPLGVPLNEFAHPPTGIESARAEWGLRAPLVALYAGGFFENKRVDRLIDAIAPRRTHWALVAIGRDVPGSPHDLSAIRRRASERGVELVAPGVLSRADVVRALFAADAVVLGSEYEGFGLLPVEAMAAGRPFIAYESGAIGDIAARGGGRAVRSKEEFTRALIELEDPARREEIGALGRREASFYSEGAMVDRFLRVYEGVLAERGIGPAGP